MGPKWMTTRCVPYDGSHDWIPFTYCSYHDFARTFTLRYRDSALVFDAPFLPVQDEYSGHFLVYQVPNGGADPLKDFRQHDLVSVIPVDQIVMDETRRRYVHRPCLDRIFSRSQLD
jgi:hypothetical protein